jgi:membrane-bound metal-dependent hydrolase YbcI (DUF457 family)
MFLFGHLGIGSKIISPLTRGLSRKAVLIGTILPDLIDKPLYYGLSAITKKQGSDLGIISGTRTFGHTALFLLLLTLISIARKSKLFAALALGTASHLLLDSWLTLFGPKIHHDHFQIVLLWPWKGWNFPVIPYHGLGEHLSIISRPDLYWPELIGLAILLWDYWKQNIFLKRRP